MSALLPPSLRLAQAIGIMTSAFLSGMLIAQIFSRPAVHEKSEQMLIRIAGGVLAVSYGFVPSMSQAPNTLLVREWQTAYGRGVAAAPPLALVSTFCYLYLSYNLSFTLNHHKGEMYALAAIATGSIVPFTLVCMKTVNGKLNSKVEKSKGLHRSEEMNESKDKKGDSSQELLNRWAVLNFTRGLLPFAGACLGFYASFFMTS